MTRYLFGLLAILGASSLLAQSSAQGGQSGCCPEPGCCSTAGCATAGCATAGCETAGCNACNNCNGCNACDCCPRCGCKLVPVCQMGCTTKTETIHKYCCACKDICIPGPTRLCDRGGDACNGGESGCCANGGGENGCCDNGGCNCRVRTVHKLVVCPEKKEHCVRTCTVAWTCPNCGCGVDQGGAVVTPPAPVKPAPAAPAPNPQRLPPAPKTTDAAPLPPEIAHHGGSGF